MGAIVRLDKMPENCRECPFASEDKRLCRIRKVHITAWERRKNRMPLCPLVNEGTYLTRTISLLKCRKCQEVKNGF